jgi:toxin YoeB
MRRINLLIADVMRDPFAGIGKPEPLKHILSGAWSRRIDDANRLVYFVTDDHIVILQTREHY